MPFLRKTLYLPLMISLFFFSCKLKESRSFEDESFSERDGMGLAMKQEFQMTYDPSLGYVPKERLSIAEDYMLQLKRRMKTTAITWQERGPSNISGRTRAFFIDSRDNTGNTIFSASVSGGIWKATNFKTTPVWTPVAENMGSLAVCALAQDPSNPSIMYAGTGEGWFNVDAVRGNGIWKSTDGGTSWSQLPFTDSTNLSKGHNFDFIQDIVVTPAGVVFATSRPSLYCNTGGVLRSTSGGASWTRPIGTWSSGLPCDSAYNFYGQDLEVASNGDVYATTGFPFSPKINNQGRIFRFTAANAASGLPVDITPTGTWRRIEIATAPSDAATIYALLQGNSDGIGAIKRSSDFGATWQDLTLPSWCNQGQTSSDFTNGQAEYDLIVQVDPTNKDVVYIGGIDWFKSTNGGSTWTQITQWAGKCGTLPVVHPDQHNLLFMPGSNTQFVVANDGGLFYTATAGATFDTYASPNVNNNGLITYSTKNIGYNITQFYSVDVHPSLTNYFLGGTQDNGTQRFSTTGLSTTVEASLGGDGGFSHIDQKTGNLQVIAIYYNNYYYSRNNGGFFTKMEFNNNGRFINPSDYDDALDFVYAADNANSMGVIRNINGSGAPTYTTVTVGALNGRQISAVKVDPTALGGGTVWVAGSTPQDGTSALTPVILKLTNAGGLNPTVVVNSSFSGVSLPNGAYVSSIDVDPSNGNHIVATISNYGLPHVLESLDGGINWSNITANFPDVPVRWAMFVPPSAAVTGTTPGGLMIATELGVWYTAPGSNSWLPQNAGFPNVRTDMLRYRDMDNLIAAATHGRGVWTGNLTPIATGIPSVPNTKDFIQYVSANNNQLVIKAGNRTTATMETKIFDMAGRLIMATKNKYADQVMDISRLAAGSYVVKIFGNKQEVYTKQFVK